MMMTAQIGQDKLLWTSREASRAMSISERTLWGLTKNGTIPCVKIGRSVRYDPDDIRAWIAIQKMVCGESKARAE